MIQRGQGLGTFGEKVLHLMVYILLLVGIAYMYLKVLLSFQNFIT